MKTTMILDDEIIKEASKATGIKGKTALVHHGLEELIKKAARMRLIKMGGQFPKASSGRRKRS